MINDPFFNRVMIWEVIKGDVERVKVYGKPATKWIEEWVSYEFDDEAVLLHALEAGIVTELQELEVDDEELGVDNDEPVELEPGDYESSNVFLRRKVEQLYKIRRKVAWRIGLRIVIIAGCIAFLVFVAWPYLISLR